MKSYSERQIGKADCRRLRELYFSTAVCSEMKFVERCMSLLHKGTDLTPFFCEVPNLYEDFVEIGISRLLSSRSGYIYVASNPVMGNDIFKVGMTRKSPSERMRSLTSAGTIGEFKVMMFWQVAMPSKVEAAVHSHIQSLNIEKEFFRGPLENIKFAIDLKIAEHHEKLDTIRSLSIARF